MILMSSDERKYNGVNFIMFLLLLVKNWFFLQKKGQSLIIIKYFFNNKIYNVKYKI